MDLAVDGLWHLINPSWSTLCVMKLWVTANGKEKIVSWALHFRLLYSLKEILQDPCQATPSILKNFQFCYDCNPFKVY